MRTFLAFCTIFLAPGYILGQEAVTFRERGGPIQTVKGKIESDTIAGIKIAGRIIPAGDVIDVQYEIPGSIKLDLPKAIQAEMAGKWEEAAKEYRAIALAPSVINNKSLKRFFDYKVAWYTAARADTNAADLTDAIEALTRFIQVHPDGWERVSASRSTARLQLDLRPPNFDGARKTLLELAQVAGAPQELKLECGFSVVDLWRLQKKTEEARKALGEMPANDPRVVIYRIGLDATPKNLDATVEKLEKMIEKSEPNVKSTIYNTIGDCYRLDPKRRKDALFAYLWVDVVYNQDPVETAKAQERLSELFHEMKDDDRAKHYRNKARGR